ncbi:radical SAM protein [Sphingomonas sp. TREG-RG-20F-R18-01]|uniref:radical SAM protein n=1 Tax=Sphingomonas sp. TREG-RG-20F-R18-01 TaxID=2914982 RepID=UPI001F58B27A|nr:radical SAM protein [Sphingomonas sp. TREG-RG-20F-R18-01]
MVSFPDPSCSPFRLAAAAPLAIEKFRDPGITAKGEIRASVSMVGLTTLWFNTGTLCNLACATCYIESSPTNDALVYLSVEEVAAYLDEIADLKLPTHEIGLTGGEPFMNRDIVPILTICLERGFSVLLLTNAMRPMRRHETELLALKKQYGDRLILRVSLDHYSSQAHEAERGAGTWEKAIDGLRWLAKNEFPIAVAGRQIAGERLDEARIGYATLFASIGLRLDVTNPDQLVLFPEMDAEADTPEISEGCWSVLGKSPSSVMCASSRMVVKRRGAARPSVAACTLIPYHPGFDLGTTLAEASRPVALNHPHCARFCVLGGASCSG